MLKFSELLSKVELVSAKLVGELVSKSILKANGFNVVDVENGTCANIEIESIEGNTVKCSNAFIYLNQVDMFDME